MNTYKKFLIMTVLIIVFMMICGFSSSLKHRQKMWQAKQWEQIEIMLDSMTDL